MMLRDLIRATAEHWPEYKAASTVAKTDPLYQLIVREFPNSLGALAPKSPAYHHEGSTGRGTVSAAPTAPLSTPSWPGGPPGPT